MSIATVVQQIGVGEEIISVTMQLANLEASLSTCLDSDVDKQHALYAQRREMVRRLEVLGARDALQRIYWPNCPAECVDEGIREADALG